MKIQVLWDMTLCWLINGYEHFEGDFCVHLQDLHSPRRVDFSDPLGPDDGSQPAHQRNMSNYLLISKTSYSRRLDNCTGM
jgi:hypothetical protein